MKGVVLACSALLFVAMVAVALWPATSGPSHGPPLAGGELDPAALEGRRGALVDQVVFTREADVGRVTGLIEAGSHQVFTQGISSPTVFHRLRDSLHATHDLSYGTSSELTLNPAGPELAGGELNPFHVPAIREALNRLVDRRYIAEEIFGGLAVPRYLPISTAFPDYARLADVARELELRYAHDPEAAREAIHREMEGLGARFTDGRWWYRDAPVRLNVLIRTEDERRRIGDYIANLMEDLGFAVERRYRTAEEASRLWIASDPRAGHWHIYTGGWIIVVILRDQADVFSYYYTPRGRPEPLWQAYQPAPEFDELSDRLVRRDYRSREERRAMMARALELAMENSARIWLVDQLNASARAANVEVAVDLAGGLSGSALWPYTLRYTDRVGGRMVFGTPNLLVEPWNPVAGSNWISDQMIMRATQDPALMPDPFTGLYLPQRIESAEVTVEEGVPVGRTLDWLSVETAKDIPVPEAAWLDWDVGAGRFVTAGERQPEGISARTRVRVTYEETLFEQRWHDGSQLSLADFLLPWILTFERADEQSRLFDIAHLPTFEAFQRHFRGWHLVSRDPLVIDIYSDQIYPDAETIVAQRAPAPIPWHTLTLGILAEHSGELAFSSNKADRLGVDWMSLVAGPSLSVLERQLRRARERGTRLYPAALGELLDEEEIAARYRALTDWHAARGHFWVGNGPFQLHSVHPVEGSLVLRRFADFPDPSDKWLHFSRPEIPELDLDGPLVVAIGEDADFRLAVTFEGEPYAAEGIDKVQFLLFDGRGELARRGEAEALDDGLWGVELSPEAIAALGAGANSLELAVTSRRVALPAFASHVFATVSPGGREGTP
ncbi:ABC transporter substrate-binding protein [Halomonas sp. LBP4]|uniref:ABC transporter substrate-binding protein n=1 Tax=Halomonas sp. LBP4 TaxID=2044917 RepID=UPI000D75C296|nr:ABC transporter substrate-binding protein [Halomonas sp. LBP4]PXX99408.1 ABC transporter substrate-binding protein [Halomonas sp. LBP4]